MEEQRRPRHAYGLEGSSLQAPIYIYIYIDIWDPFKGPLNTKRKLHVLYVYVYAYAVREMTCNISTIGHATMRMTCWHIVAPHFGGHCWQQGLSTIAANQ